MEHLYGYTEKGEEFIFDRKTVTMPHALVIGKAGTGKTQMIQQEIVSNLLTGDENDKIIVVDENGEYKDFAKKHGGEIVNFTDTFINPCDLPLNSSQKIVMADFLISFSEIILGKECNAVQKAIISKAVSSMYSMYMYEVIKTDRPIKREECPTLASFYDKLSCYSEREIDKLLIAIEPYCKGMFDCFANRTNVNLDCRLIVIDLSSINIRRMALALHVTLMFLWSVLIENNSYSENTWIYFEDFHRYFKNPILTDTFLQIFKRARTKGGIITGITQQANIPYPVLHTIENLILLSQSKNNAELLKETYYIPDNLMKYITEKPQYVGLMQFNGGEFIPFTK